MSLNSDKPKSNQTEDRFQRYNFAKRIAHIISLNASDSSLVIGLYGKWGEGKTSVMNFVKQELPREDNLLIDFNPWLFNDQEHLLKAFFNEIAAALNTSIKTSKEQIGKVLSDYGDLIGAVKFAGIGLPNTANLGKKLSDVTVEQLKERVNEAICDSGKRIVIFVDDIDRLDAKEVQYLFKLIKLVGDFYNTTYVLAFDDEMVAGALAPFYGDGQKNTGYQFLEKIIQAPLVIPKATKSALVKYSMALIDEVIKQISVELSDEDVARFRNIFDESFVPAITNPRLSLRYANSLFFSLPLLQGEIAVSDLMITEALKVFYPLAYDFMRSNSRHFLTDHMKEGRHLNLGAPDKGKIQSDIKELLKNQPEKDQERIRNVWKELFPQYRYTTSDQGYTDTSWRDWYREKRICSGKYFERYFTYAVIEGDISDNAFQDFLREIMVLPVDEALAKMRTLFDENEIPEMIFKIRLWEDLMNPLQSEKLANILVRIGNELPVEDGEFASYTSRAEGAKIIAQLIANQKLDKRVFLAMNIFDGTANLDFAMEVSYWLHYKNENSRTKILTDGDEILMREYFLERLGKTGKIDTFFTMMSDGHLWRMMIWWNEKEPEGLNETISKVLSGNAGQAIRLIKVFAPSMMSWSSNGTHDTYKGGFTEKRYESMTQLIDPKPVYDILKNAGYEASAVGLEQQDDREKMSDDELASRFMQCYKKKVSKKA
ncbi:MAG TPA: P-loop NTPase fold protein [Mucilaginibacter sp.]|jgi:hypothetical protein|nr:P-loop NTPase fold protein [Mucilaginibacter sp.]